MLLLLLLLLGHKQSCVPSSSLVYNAFPCCARNHRGGTEVTTLAQKWAADNTGVQETSSWNSSELPCTEACLKTVSFDTVQELSSWHRSEKFGTEVGG
ncbi:hypothetical protein M0812_08913 [Anaeramoeba flamelloides]|uniref:Secreted protein n=1 Tax=Anaeramoeba flamelloides TaxID=1746091 RepID=A0AAV7ZZM9_9EUKA|nr:hypothetical protein M0812_08913 [Anaeramoeba flamelloides]